MQFACEKCGTRYAVPDEKVRGKRVRTKCRKCGSEILVEGPPGQPGDAPRSTGSVIAAMRAGVPSQPAGRSQPAPASARTRSTEERWTVALSRTSRRRMTTAELVQGYEGGKVTNAALVWKAGMEEWQSPFDIPALALALQARGFGRPDVVPKAEKEISRREALPVPALDASDWDDEAATQVVDSSLRFPGRPSRGPDHRNDVPAPAPLPPLPPLPPPPPAPPPEPVKVEEHWTEEDDEETTALPPAPGATDGAAPAGHVKPKPFEFDDEATAVIAPDRARELLAEESAKNITLPPPPGMNPVDAEEEATQVFEADHARPMVSAHAEAGAWREAGRPRPPERLPRQPPRIPVRKPPPSGAPLAETPIATAEPGPPQPPRPRTPPPPDAEAPTEEAPLVQRRTPEPPKPAAGAPPLASLAPPKPSSAPPPQKVESAPPPQIVVSPPPPEPPRPEEPSVVVAETKPAVEPALPTMPRQRPPAAPRMRAMQNEPTRVVRVVKKGPGVAFWVVLVLALLAAAAGGFVVSQMLRDRGAPSWLKKS